MINGEGAEEKPSSAVTSPCDRGSDGGDDLSYYSSCGGESEFERYCSASSAMGTPSFRSNSFKDSDVWSLKSFKLGGGSNNMTKDLGIERVLSGINDVRDFGMPNLNVRVEGFVVNDVGLQGNFDMDSDLGNKIGTDKENVETGEGSSGISIGRGHGKEIGKVEGLEIDGGEGRNFSNESEASSRSEHSEGEDSMFGCGSDDERRSQYYLGKNAPFCGGGNPRNENPLVMNSAVAFGSDDWDDFDQENNLGPLVWDRMPSGIESSNFKASNSISYSGMNLKRQQTEVGITPAACNQVKAVGKSLEENMSALSLGSTGPVEYGGLFKGAEGVHVPSYEVSDIDELAEYIGYNPDYNLFQRNKDSVEQKAMTNGELKVGILKSEMKEEDATQTMTIQPTRGLPETNVDSDPLSESADGNHHLAAGKDKETGETMLDKDKSKLVPASLQVSTSNATTKKKNFSSFDQIEDHFAPDKDSELNEFYNEIVDDMKDILLDSSESMGSRFGNRMHQSQFHRTSRDGGSSASTSGTDYAYNSTQPSCKIHRIEVVGARQVKGDVSFSERLVGVQKYTMYKIKVWSGEGHWVVERRYRDFSTLYFRLKKLFLDHGWTLPSPWLSVEKESRKLFGNASPDVVADRTHLIQECLQSVIYPKFFAASLNAITDFLSPSNGAPNSPASDISASRSQLPEKGSQLEDFSTLGKTISLLVQIPPLKSMRQILDAQHYRCAGCHKNFDDGRTRVQEFVQVLGWGKPRLCEYSGQLFCSSCHNNDYAVLPARVLHSWDFTRYPVSQLAKSFLDSISDKPMLCVGAVNPFLFSKVPTLQHVANIRNRIISMMPYVRCPFHRSVQNGLGSRKYLLDSSDFFALRDLVDLSKGVFSALPAMVETVSRKIQEHITEQCLICYDVGIPCTARKDCDNPLSVIFPFQDGEVEKCRSCKSVFHKSCFEKIAICPCGARFKQEVVKQNVNEGTHNMNSNSSLVKQTAAPGNGLLSGLFFKLLPGQPQTVRKQDSKNADNVILMGSLPNVTL